MEVKRWVVGLFVAVVLGGIVVPLFLYCVRGVMGVGDKPKPKIKRVPPWLTGFIERFVFAVLVGLDVPGAPTAMMGWLALKLASNWNRKDMEDVALARPFSFTALLAGLISMMFAALGGMVASGKLWSGIVENI
jgi:hypothetical protein